MIDQQSNTTPTPQNSTASHLQQAGALAGKNTIGLFDFLENHLDYRIKLVGFALLVIATVVLWNYIRDLRAEVANEVKTVATLKQDYQQLGNNAVTKNELQTQSQLNSQASQLFGQQVMDFMHQHDSQIISITNAIGQIEGTVAGLQHQPDTFKPSEQKTGTGILTGFPLEENRDGKPPLTSVDLFYDPSKADPNQAFMGTKWTNYKETFDISTGTWSQDKTHGYKNTVSLTRTVTKPDGSTAQEPIPILSGSTIYAPKGITPVPVSVPRWTFSLGLSKGYQPAASLDYRFTNRFGVTGGVVNQTPYAGISIRFGGVK